ncbi:FMN-binding negative transcriptional regulator [Kordiimonas lacus]|uniref:Negative transcriptional regulator, PaiB family n=1 Tax=Kordiimonas lacus TaxID=637679 RepID=A0A1G7FE02_9PROT|nr:FMN-binding negative transcriptional regulator [Kordiimonas lacus]SDE74116.1 negative transcriptional regulator, PaiB family [Kordiimonas lacus]
MMTEADTPLFKSWDNAGQDIFVPEHYAMQGEGALYAFIAANPVGQVFTAHDGNQQVTAAPIIRAQRLDVDRPLLAGHMAVRNPQCDAIIAGASALVSFSTGGAYISPRWFRKNVVAPTWSYVSVQVRGRLKLLPEPDCALDVLDRTVAHMEALAPCREGERPWSMDALTPEQMKRYVPMVMAFHLEVEAIEGICRLNQEKDRADMESIIDGLRGQGAPGAQHIARLMQANLDTL